LNLGSGGRAGASAGLAVAPRSGVVLIGAAPPSSASTATGHRQADTVSAPIRAAAECAFLASLKLFIRQRTNYPPAVSNLLSTALNAYRI